MAYVTPTEVREILTGVTIAVMSEVAMIEHIKRADSEIDIKIGSRYTTSLASPVPEIIATIAVDIAAFYAMRTLYTQDAQNKSDWTLELYKKANELLDKIADGKYSLKDAAGVLLPTNSDEIESTTENFIPTSQEDDIINQKVSEGKLDDIESQRDSD